MILISFIQGKTVHGLVEYSASQAVGHSPKGFWATGSFIDVRKGNAEKGMVG